MSRRPEEFIQREEEEVRRKSSVNPNAMRLASQHRRFSAMSEAGRASGDNGSGVDEKEEYENGYEEKV